MTTAPHHEVVHLPAIDHAAPIPLAARVGNVLFTSAIEPRDPKTGELVEGVVAQMDTMLGNLRIVLEEAGATPLNVVHVTIWLKDFSESLNINPLWVKMYADKAYRPARNRWQTRLPEGQRVALTAIAVLP